MDKIICLIDKNIPVIEIRFNNINQFKHPRSEEVYKTLESYIQNTKLYDSTGDIKNSKQALISVVLDFPQDPKYISDKLRKLHPIKKAESDFIIRNTHKKFCKGTLMLYEQGCFIEPRYDSSRDLLNYLIFPPDQKITGGLLRFYKGSDVIYEIDPSKLDKWTLVVFPYNLKHECTVIERGKRYVIKLDASDLKNNRNRLNGSIISHLNNMRDEDIDYSYNPIPLDGKCFLKSCKDLIDGEIDMETFKTEYNNHIQNLLESYDYKEEVETVEEAQYQAFLRTQNVKESKDTVVDVDKVEDIINDYGECLILLERPYLPDFSQDKLVEGDKLLFTELSNRYTVITEVLTVRSGDGLKTNRICNDLLIVAKHYHDNVDFVLNKESYKRYYAEYNGSMYRFIEERVIACLIVLPKLD